MNPHRFDSISRLLANRRTNRLRQGATPIPATPRPADAPAFMFVQSFQAGALAPAAVEGLYTLTLTHGLGQTIYFSDRPQRVVGSLPTAQFFDALGFPGNNPPNAALVADRADHTKDILVVELFNPEYDEATHNLTYTVRILDDIEQVDMALPQTVSTPPTGNTQYGATHLFIDDCKDGAILCYADMLQTKFQGCSAVHMCWVWSHLDCYPCSTGANFGQMADLCGEAFGGCDASGCSAGLTGECV